MLPVVHHKTKPMKIITRKMLFLFTLIITVSTQGYTQSKDSLFVYATSGLNIRKTSDPNSEIISNIPYGEKILPDWTEQSENIELRIKTSRYINNKKTPEFHLSGRMVKIEYKGVVGFVFSGLLSSFQAFPHDKGFGDFLLSKFDTCKTFKYNNYYYSDQKMYNNGINSFTQGNGGGCQETTYIIPGISLQEGFLIAYNILRLGNSKNIDNEILDWYIWEKDDNYIHIKGIYQLEFSATIRSFNGFVILKEGVYN